MRVCGVICEYNPFHRGHAYHLAKAREKSGADYVVCVMSGAITQRGAFARHDKWARAQMALCGGADLVLELPARFAGASAPEFARGGVSLLGGLGVVTHLSFGCEPDALPVLGSAARLLAQETPAFREALREGLGRGLPYPRARALAAERISGIAGLSALLAQPNAALALEYLAALPPQILPVPVAREGAGYHDKTLCALSSATAVRAALSEGRLQDALSALPSPQIVLKAEQRGAVHPDEALTQALLYRLRTMDAPSLAAIAGMGEGLHHRFLAAARTATTRDGLILAVKSKRYTYARLSRIAQNVLLDVTEAFVQAHPLPTYARVLGFRRQAAPLLHAVRRACALPLVTKTAGFSDPLFALDVRAQDMWALGAVSPAERACGRDFTTSPVVLP